jgi:dipeptide transport system ATP-binding protein
MASMPERSEGKARLATIAGMVPGLYDRPEGCLFAPRCQYVRSECATRPALQAIEGGAVRCHFPINRSANHAIPEVIA